MKSDMTNKETLSIAVTGSGGAGALTAGNLLLEVSAKVGCYGVLTRSVGPQIRGGEAAAMLRLSANPVNGITDRFDVMVAMDWNNVDRFASEIILDSESVIIADPEQGEIPEVIAKSGARVLELPMTELAKQVSGGRVNMIAVGALAEILGLPETALHEVLEKQLSKKGEKALKASLDTLYIGRQAVADADKYPLPINEESAEGRWIITGNHAAGLGAIRGGVRFVAAYPITPATEVLEWLSKSLPEVGGALVQAEDELASINMAIGASYGGVPALTATSGPGLALMIESLGLAVGSETPVVVVDVMRAGPSTGIATKSEQSDLNIAIYGLHGDAPHLVLAPNSIADCIFTTQWSMYLAEAMQTPAIVLSDQYLGQARSVIDAPADVTYIARREVNENPSEEYRRYELTANGISPMTIPGTPNGGYVADGLEHNTAGTPSGSDEDRSAQMDKRLKKVNDFDYGDQWADISGEGEMAVITWGSTTGVVKEAIARLRDEGIEDIRLISLRLLLPVQEEKFEAALSGVKKALIIEQSHTPQFYRYLRAHYDLPKKVDLFHRAAPLMMRPGEIYTKLKACYES
jgi:2-oxoglutarate/2-oxoacid ferredoxin oxidoreductase subunit alpha